MSETKPIHEMTLQELYRAMSAEMETTTLLMIKGLPQEAQVHAQLATVWSNLILAEQTRRAANTVSAELAPLKRLP
jgi:hypothetical protein